MSVKKSARNKTLSLTDDEQEQYFSRAVTISGAASIDQITNRTVYGDALKVLDRLPEVSVDLLIVDPPYNLSKNYHGKTFRSRSNEEYEEFTRTWVRKCVPLLKSTASVYVCCDWRSSLVIGNVLAEFFTIQNRITWQREKGRGAKTNWKNSMEDIWFATVSEKKYVFNVQDILVRRKVIAPYKSNGKPKDWEVTDQGNFRNTYPSNFWDDITVPFWSMPENTEHPTQKPEKLVAKLILASSNEGDMVLDPFLGSGTTSVTAKKLGRKYVGIEENKMYCAWAEKRLELVDKDRTIQGYTDGVFWERNTLAVQQKTAPSVSESERFTPAVVGLF